MGSQSTVAKWVVRHPTLDIALVKLQKPLAMNGLTYGHRFELEPTPASELIGETAQCYGYGRFTFQGGGGTLRTAELEIIDAPTNEIKFGRNDDGQAHWRGDSGSSCLYNGKVIGPVCYCVYSLSAQEVYSCGGISSAVVYGWAMTHIRDTRSAPSVDLNGDGITDLFLYDPSGTENPRGVAHRVLFNSSGSVSSSVQLATNWRLNWEINGRQD
jgi:hypothetical protein